MSQANVVTSEAARDPRDDGRARISSRSCFASDLARADQWSGQQIDVVQVGHAAAAASQRDVVLTRSGKHGAFGHAVADGTADVEQVCRAGRDRRRRLALAVGGPARARRADR